MSTPQQSVDNEFLSKLNASIEEKIADGQFGVAELARQLGMSRSNLLRKVRAVTNLSVNQLIRQQRLRHAMDLLKETALNVTEVSYRTGFSSPSYFIKCFREHYGYSPGEVGKRDVEEVEAIVEGQTLRNRGLLWATASGVIMLVLAAVIYFFLTPVPGNPVQPEKSIAVLPFKNDSNDSTNVYLINGLMESTLNNLQKIRDLKVISRTSSEKYRNTTKSIPEMAGELKVNYFVEGSGQKIGDKILLNIQLIEASTDRHLWSKQYRRETKDIFDLQQEVAKNIATEIEAIITPEEAERIEKVPTHDLVAYDYYLQGLDLLLKGGRPNQDSALVYFQKALSRDNEFALALANTAIAYYYLDIFQTEKKHTAAINSYADRALLADPKLPESLIAKALYFMHSKQFNQAVPYLEKALEYNPNSAYAIFALSDFYANYSPNTAKYLEYALKGIQLDAAAKDSVDFSYFYLHLSNALIQSGFVDEAVHYINKSLVYNPANPYANYVNAFIKYARHRDLGQTKADLLKEFARDTTRIDILQDIAKVSYYMGDYQEAYRYYKPLIDLKDKHGMNPYRHEASKIAIVLAKIGQEEKAAEYFADYRQFLETDQSMYQPLGLAAYHAWHGDNKEALRQLEIFSQRDYVMYWVILFFDKEPSVENLKHHPEFKRLVKDMNNRFWANHDELKGRLVGKGLL